MQRKTITTTKQSDSLMKYRIEALRAALIKGEQSGVSNRKLPDILQAVKNKHNTST